MCQLWNILGVYNQRKITSDLNMSDGKMSNFVPFSFFGLNLVKKLRNFDFESHWNTKKIWCQIWLCAMATCLILKSFEIPWDPYFESHWNALIYFDKKRYAVDLNMSHRKMSDFVSFSLFEFTLVMKLINFEFKSH